VRLTRHVAQAALLPRCDAVVAHGGYGSLLGALAHGRPVVSVPLAAPDNVRNAVRLEGRGAGIAVPEHERSPERVREAVRTILTDPSYRTAAGVLAAEIAALPDPIATAALIEQHRTAGRSAARSGTERQHGSGGSP
jgi:UDP:flavonoid glycosyltransferase YjiC (YdhE family)